jgi:hypothetical protein
MNHGVAHETVVVGFGLDVKCVAFWLYFFGEVPSKNWWIDHQKKGKLFSGNCGNGISIFSRFFSLKSYEWDILHIIYVYV